MDFNYFLPVNLVFGRGKFNLLGEITKGYGSKALIVTYANSADSPLIERATEILKSAGVDVVIFDQVFQNPLTTTAIAGAKMACDNSCDVVIGIGGGSIMDCAKAIAFLAENDGDINDYIFGVKVSNSALPIVLVPTTCGTGSEANGFSVLTNPDTGDKKSLNNPCIMPKVAIVDPELMKTMPKEIFASVAFDATCHLMEAYLCKTHQKISDVLILDALERIVKHIKPIYQSDDATAYDWEEVTYASTIGGMVIYVSGVCLPHALEHPISGLKDVAHGLGLASIVPEITKRSSASSKERYSVISKIFGGKDEKDCHIVLQKFIKSLNLTCKLTDFSITAEDIPWLTENAFKVSVYSMGNHPATFSKEEISDIYKACL